MKNTVTIAIPVYNGEKYIQEALVSIARQTAKIDEILISDNLSTDKTIEIINVFKTNHPNQIIRINSNTKNLGAVGNFNKCIELCKTDFLVILGSDDRLKPFAIEKQLSLFNKMPELALVGGIFDTIDSEGNTKRKPDKREPKFFDKGDILEFMRETAFYMQHSTIMYNMKFTRKIGYLDVDFIAPDERFSVRHLAKYPIAQIREAITESRQHTSQGTNDERLRFDDKKLHFEANLDMAKYESTPERKKELEKELKKWIATQCIPISRFIRNNFDQKQIARKYWYYGLKTDPVYYSNRYFFSKLKRAVKRF